MVGDWDNYAHRFYFTNVSVKIEKQKENHLLNIL